MKNLIFLGCASFVALQAAFGAFVPASADSPTVLASAASVPARAAAKALATTDARPALIAPDPGAASCSTKFSPSAAMEARFLMLINGERTARGESTLTLDPLLQSAARAHSQEMCSRNYFSHISPSPGLATPIDRYSHVLRSVCATLPSAYMLGENIFFCSTFDSYHNADYGHSSLMHSAPHRQNILEARFTKVGIGVYMAPSGAFWVTQMFLRDQP